MHLREERGEPSDLIEAVSNGRIDSIQTMVEHGNDVYLTDDCQNTLLHFAMRSLELKSMQFLLRKGLSINAQNSNGETPLHLVIGKDKKEGNYSEQEVVAFAIENGSDPNLKDKLGDSALSRARRVKRQDLVLSMQEREEQRVLTPSTAYSNGAL